MKFLLLLAALAVGCGGSSEPTLVVELPPTCRVELEHVRVQLCPSRPVMVNCTNHLQRNVAPGHCGGPDYITWEPQVSGNAWCCDDAVEFVP